MPRKIRKTRKRKGGMDRRQEVAAVMKEVLPEVPAENIAGHVEAMEEKKRFNFGMYDRKFKKHGDGLLSRGLSDAKSIADLHHTPHEKDVKDWFLENGGQSEGPFSPKEIGHAVFKDTEEQSLLDFLYYHPSRAWARRGGRRKTNRKNKTRKRKGGGGEGDKHDEKAVESEMLGWKPGSRVLPDKVSDNILLQRKILMLEDAIKATTERPRYPYNENGLESFQERREYPNSHTEGLHPLGRSVKLAVTKTEGSDAQERSGDSDYQKVMVAFSSPPDYEIGAPKWLAGKDFVKNHPFLIGDTIYIRTGSTDDEKFEQVLGKITNFEEKFIPYIEIPEGAIGNIGVGTPLVPYERDEQSGNRIRNEKGQPLAKYHASVAEDMWPDPAHAAIVAEERAKNPPGMYVLEISYDSNRPPGDSGLIDKYNAYLHRGDPVSLRFDYRDYHGYGPNNFAQAYVYTKLSDRKARLKELKAALAKGKTGTTQKKSIPDDGSGPGKVKKGGKKRTRKRKPKRKTKRKI